VFPKTHDYDKKINILTTDMRRRYADNKDFLPGRSAAAFCYGKTGSAQAKASCLSGLSVDRIAKRLKFLPPQACRAEALREGWSRRQNICVRPRLSSERLVGS